MRAGRFSAFAPGANAASRRDRPNEGVKPNAEIPAESVLPLSYLAQSGVIDGLQFDPIGRAGRHWPGLGWWLLCVSRGAQLKQSERDLPAYVILSRLTVLPSSNEDWFSQVRLKRLTY